MPEMTSRLTVLRKKIAKAALEHQQRFEALTQSLLVLRSARAAKLPKSQ
jgi:hypothetical protein